MVNHTMDLMEWLRK